MSALAVLGWAALWLVVLALAVLLRVRTRERDEARTGLARATRETLRDPLTRLANRTGLAQRLAACLQGGDGLVRAVTVLYIDIDNFKAVNDCYGHSVGDALLCAFATRLVSGVRQGDVAARLSGDEFAVLLDGMDAIQAEPIAQALLDRLSQPYGVGDIVLDMSASIGLASYPEDGADAATLVTAADAAMYQAKAAGKGDFRRSDWGLLGHVPG